MDTEFFECPRLYIQAATNTRDLIKRIDALVLATMDAMLIAATGQDVEEYRLDDGQTRINVTSRSMDQMSESIRALERLKSMYINLYNGHSVRLGDHESLRLLNFR